MEVLATKVTESLLSAVISRLVDKSAFSSDLLKFARKENLDTEIKKWHKTLILVNAVLADAEQKQTNSKAVKEWFTDLRNLVYDVEDVLDKVNYEALRYKFTQSDSSSSNTSMVRTLFPSCCTSFNPSAVFSNVKIGSKLRKNTARLCQIIELKNGLGLKENFEAAKLNGIVERLRSTSLVDQSCVYGREADKERIVELLLLGGEASPHLTVIPITGMGGMGKTTLAQLAYNDDRVKDHFDLKAWVCVSEDFDIFKITRAIWQYVTPEACQFDTIALLQEKLKEKLSGKKFFFVIDDVWNENAAHWEALCQPFRTGVSSCKLIVTTRNESVVLTTDATSLYRLGHLSVGDSVSLLECYALGAKTFTQFPSLKDVAKQIVEKCGCLPLAVKVLGGLLRNKTNLHEWEAVLRSDIWDLSEGQNGILPALKLSYHYLPAPLKCCFVYCSLFPKDYEFEKDELVSLWMAEGFLHRHKGTKEMEDLGCEYFDELLSRSFFQQSSADEKKYVMHDLMNDLARFVAKQEKLCMSLDEEMNVCEGYNVDENVRHSSFIPSKFGTIKRFRKFSDLKHLRTFLALHDGGGGFYWRTHFLSYNVLHELLPKFKCLRVLSLPCYAINVLPDTIGDLILLRHLNLSWSHITRLPDSVGALYNLQTLILYRCSHLVELPKEIKNLVELQKLDLAYTSSLQDMPSGISSLTKLRTLSKFIVSKGDKLKIRELQGLTRLRGQLSIYGLDNVKDNQDVRMANLKERKGLDKIALIWNKGFNASRNERHEMSVLHLLKPNENLKELRIESYGGNDFPGWLGDPLFANMVSITLLRCNKSNSLPSLGGLPSLKYLHIEGMDRVERVGTEFYGMELNSSKYFPILETLEFENMVSWVDWSCSNAGEFPRLCKLKIIGCPNLKGNLPSQLPSLVKFEISNCPQLMGSLVSLPSLVEMRIRRCNASAIRSMVNLNSLTTLSLKEISGLSGLDEVLVNSLARLVYLEIRNCKELTFLWKTGEQLQTQVTTEEPFHTCGLKFLQRLDIWKCEALDTLPYWSLQKQCVLEELSIKKCPLIRSFNRSSLPATLKKLDISECNKLEYLPKGLMHDGDDNDVIGCHLEHLFIADCPSLKSFPPGKFPVTLKRLFIDAGSKQLESLSEENFQNDPVLQYISILNHPNQDSVPIGLRLGRLMHLTQLDLFNCSGIVSFPENALLSTPNLNNLFLKFCENLKLLPSEMHKVDSLKYLYLRSCPRLVQFPEDGLPPNLTSFEVDNCKNLKQPIREWGLDTLTSLKYLIMKGPISSTDEIISFPENCCILPSSITKIEISGFKNIESISSSLQSLAFLQRMGFEDCPKLRSLPKEGLPDSLGKLMFINCPVGERCIKEKGGDCWAGVSHIPLVTVCNSSITE